jgi:large subunit ribosomal protein L19e
MSTVRPLRRALKELRADSQIDNATYRKLYMLIKGGQFRSRSHMRIYMEQHGMLKKKK